MGLRFFRTSVDSLMRPIKRSRTSSRFKMLRPVFFTSQDQDAITREPRTSDLLKPVLHGVRQASANSEHRSGGELRST